MQAGSTQSSQQSGAVYQSRCSSLEAEDAETNKRITEEAATATIQPARPQQVAMRHSAAHACNVTKFSVFVTHTSCKYT